MTNISDINNLLQEYSKKLTPICENEDTLISNLKVAESDEYLNVKVASLYMKLIKLKKDVGVIEQIGTIGLRMRQ